MPGDYSRKTFNRRKHYSGVLMQQGRVQLDSDWNEQLDAQLYRTHTEAVDVVGASGVPKHNGGFRIGVAPGARDLSIAPGRLYVDGLLCELEQPALYTTQPHFPNPEYTTPDSSPPGSGPQLSLVDGLYLVFLDAWHLEITARDDRLIREVALGGPDTTTRLQTVYQVKLLPLSFASPPASPIASPPGALTCDSSIAEFDQLTAASTGMLNARTQAPQSQTNACVLPPSAGYKRLENQLYRVEVHVGGALNQATFKWSRDNGSIETHIEHIDGSVVTVSDIGKDDVLGFAGLQWVEIVDEESTLKSTPHALIQIDRIDPARREITLKTSVSAFAALKGLKLRRWDQTGVSATATGVSASLANWIDLEGGIQVRFSSGQYHAGDYWLIPARTVTAELEWPPYEIPNEHPIPQPPRGIHHHYCRLALVAVSEQSINVLEDCRKPFPALTDICAEDVCFENDACNLAGAKTVQDALDRLCQERDLRFHKKHLHGWGIVCGLQVECGPDSRSVTVREGYAIACEGDDIIVDRDERVDVLSLVEAGPASPLASRGPIADSDVCLVLNSDPGSATPFLIEPFVPGKGGLSELLKGTLLTDFFTDCIQSLIDFVKDEFTPAPGEANLPVGPTQKRITTFANLLIQLVNTQNGSSVFLSGQAQQSGANLEDTLLRDFYTKLRAKLQSHTFCAMFDNARAFPPYPYQDLGIATIFSKNFKTRFRVSPDSKVGYAVGAGSTINVFDLTKDEMVAEVEFPGGSAAVVQDVAFSQDGTELYAAATINDKDSMFAVADISAGGFPPVFRKPTMICDVLLVSLGTSPSTLKDTFVYAIGKSVTVQRAGLYQINPANVDADAPPFYQFPAVGHLVIDDAAKQGFASVSTIAGVVGLPSSYNQVVRLNLEKQTAQLVFTLLDSNQLPLSGSDDIAVATVDQQRKLYAVVDGSTPTSNKRVLVVNADTQAPMALVDLPQRSTTRLAYNPVTRHLMVSDEDGYRVRLLNPKDQPVSDFVPVQISPRGLAMAPDQQRAYVLNYLSNTISAVPSKLFATGQQIDISKLIAYRAGVLEAFADLLGGLLQYLKDCLCDHLLVDCPTCGPDDKIYLACISIKNGKVFKVCNFSHRKYVHSFPTVEYWLSAIPILPLLKKAVEEFCCAALPGFFGRFTAAAPNNIAGQNRVSGDQLFKAVTFMQQANFKGAVTEQTTKFTSSFPLVGDFIGSTANRLFIGTPKAVSRTDLVGQPVDKARRTLEDAKVTVVNVEAYDPQKSGQELVAFAGAPVRLEQGAQVNLVTKDDKVLFYSRATDTSSTIANLHSAVDATHAEIAKTVPLIGDLRTEFDTSAADASKLRQEVSDLKAELLQTNESHQHDLGVRDAQIAELQAGVKEFQTQVQAIKDLQAEVIKLQTGPGRTGDRPRKKR